MRFTTGIAVASALALNLSVHPSTASAATTATTSTTLRVCVKGLDGHRAPIRLIRTDPHQKTLRWKQRGCMRFAVKPGKDQPRLSVKGKAPRGYTLVGAFSRTDCDFLGPGNCPAARFRNEAPAGGTRTVTIHLGRIYDGEHAEVDFRFRAAPNLCQSMENTCGASRNR